MAGTPAVAAPIVLWGAHPGTVSEGAGQTPKNDVMWLHENNTGPQFKFGWFPGYQSPVGLQFGFRTVSESGPSYFHFFNSSLYSARVWYPGETIDSGSESSNPPSNIFPEDALGTAAAFYAPDNSHLPTPPVVGSDSPRSNLAPGGLGAVAFSYLDDNLEKHYGYAVIQAPVSSAAGQVANLLGVAYESTPNTAITVTSIPEIDPATGGSALSLVAGVLAMIEQRRRRATVVA
jgi:hypothetical protein